MRLLVNDAAFSITANDGAMKSSGLQSEKLSSYDNR